MKWDVHLHDVRQSNEQRQLFKLLKSPALPNEREYVALQKVVLSYLLRGMDIGWGHKNQLRVRTHLAQGENVYSTT
jgi:hypothetical protein